MYQTLIPPPAVFILLHSPSPPILLDTRFSLADTERGRRAFAQAHLPGAQYAHLDEDLSAPVIPGATGRHPLPDIPAIAEKLGKWGITDGVQVVAYDDAGGGIAARAWWLLRWLGHDAAAVLDGGWAAWLAAGLPTSTDTPPPAPARFTPRPRPQMLVDAAHILANPPGERLIDSRSPDRYRGENETLDPVAGHIPGAVNAFYGDTATPAGISHPPAELRARFQALLGGVPPAKAIFYCGSGVTAARNILAMEHAGLHGSRLYAGSWSEWITDPRRGIASGE
jgi:thiosulfate/3-mercaptopyruvate sulfurtransferase